MVRNYRAIGLNASLVPLIRRLTPMHLTCFGFGVGH